MDIADFLVSLNKISLIALLVIVGFLSYQIYLFKKETESKKKKLVIPDFKASSGATPFQQSMQTVAQKEKKAYIRSSKNPIIIGVILFFVFGMIFIFSMARSKSESQTSGQDLTITPVINFVASKGIKIYNQNWEEISDDLLRKMKPGQHIFIGVETIKGADIDMARIRVNKNVWNQNDIAIDFNKKLNVLFKEHIVSTGESFLKVEAQLHSKTDGWLGD